VDKAVNAAPGDAKAVAELTHRQALRLRRQQLEHIDDPVGGLHHRLCAHSTPQW
jgi:hypothetical protein